MTRGHPAPPVDSEPRRIHRRRGWVVFGGGIALLWGGCSIEKNYRLLSFFFDGVPDPRMLAEGKNSVRIAKETGGVYYIHNPYAQQQCNECHGGTFTGDMRADVDPKACLKCHASVAEQYPYMHGPVTANACIWCHAPHEATVKPLLRTTVPQLCQQCHGPALMGTPKSPVHSDLTRDCLECHNGHGGQARYYLRPEMPLTNDRGGTGPATSQPAATSD